MTTLSFGEKLLILRKKKGLSQRKLAEMMGISFNNLPKYESSQVLPKPDLLLKLSAIFDVSIDYLLIADHQNPEIMNIKDIDFLKLIKEVDDLPEQEKNRLKSLIKSYLTGQMAA